jgi:hypothetical protein
VSSAPCYTTTGPSLSKLPTLYRAPGKNTQIGVSVNKVSGGKVLLCLTGMNDVRAPDTYRIFRLLQLERHQFEFTRV